MKRRRFKLVDALMLVLATSLVPLATPTAHAAVIGSLDYATQAARGERVERIQSFLDRDTVRSQMVALGVNPGDIETRLSTLTDAELALLEERIESMPAGGDALAVIGVVFLVLLVLELVGVTNVFSKF